MKTRKYELESEAKRLMGMSGVEVYERARLSDHYFDIVWRGKKQWSIGAPWNLHKDELREVGRALRYRVDAEEKFEKALHFTEKLGEEEAKDAESDMEVMVKDVKRTCVDKPLYFY